MAKKKIYYYHEDKKDDFGTVGRNNRPLKDNFKYVSNNIFFRIVSFILYYIFAFPILFIVSKIVLGVKVKGKKNLKAISRKEGYFIYFNHVHYYDAFIPHIFFGVPRRTYIISHADAVNIPFIGTLVMMLGCLPLPNNINNYKSFLKSMEKRVKNKGVIAIYPEGTLWPYYNGLRPFESGSFKYPAMFDAPVFVCSETFREPKILKKVLKPRMTLTLSEVIRPEKNKTIKENTQLLYEEALEFLNKNVCNVNNVGYHTYLPIKKNELN